MKTTEVNLPEIIAFNASIPVFEKLGATVQLDANFPAQNELESHLKSDRAIIKFTVDFSAGLEEYLQSLIENPSKISNLADLINYTKNTPVEEYPSRDISRWEEGVALKLTKESPKYLETLATDLRLGSTGTILGALERVRVVKRLETISHVGWISVQS